MKRWLIVAVMLATSVGGGIAAAAERTLFIALDAVPYQTVVDAISSPDEGGRIFQGFHGPVPLISTFPSSTSIALAGILGPFDLQSSPGYEARFYDWQEGKVRGGGPVSYYRIDFPWREFFDWNRKGPVRNFFQSARPARSAVRELENAIDLFVDSDEDSFFVYNAATDTTAHVAGPDALRAILEELDSLLRRARARSARPFATVIFSDHGISGGEPLINVRKPLNEALRTAGFTDGPRLVDGRTVVTTPFGLVSSLEVYTHDEHEREVAELLASVAGVGFCVYREGQEWVIVDLNGAARFRREQAGQRTTWHYDSESGDPLDLSHLFERGEGRVDRDLFDLTASTTYPDPLHRVVRSFELVENPASLLCSVAPGYMYGLPSTERIARLGKGRLRWTHGALDAEASLGFILSDAAGWAPSGALRFDEALLAFRGETHETALGASVE